MAELRAALKPPRTARAPPVKKPAITRHASQKCLTSKDRTIAHTSIVGVLLLPHALDGTVERREHATPDAKVTTEHRSPGLDGGQSTYPALTVGTVAETLDTVPNSTTDSLNRETSISRLNLYTNERKRVHEDVHPCRKLRQSRSVRPTGRDLWSDPLCVKEKGEGRVRRGGCRGSEGKVSR